MRPANHLAARSKYSAQRAPLELFRFPNWPVRSHGLRPKTHAKSATRRRVSRLSRTASVLACRKCRQKRVISPGCAERRRDCVLAIKSPRPSIAHIAAKKRLVDGFNPAYQIAPAGDRANLALRVASRTGSSDARASANASVFSVPRPARQIVASHPEPRRCSGLCSSVIFFQLLQYMACALVTHGQAGQFGDMNAVGTVSRAFAHFVQKYQLTPHARALASRH